MRTSQPGNLCNSRSRLVYPLADDAVAHEAVGIVALRINRALCLRYRIGVRDQEGVICSGVDQADRPRCFVDIFVSGLELGAFSLC